MDKQYFAKYLPVEGEIKEGTNTVFNRENKFAVINVVNKAAAKDVGYRLAKFFLCSRDIQIGDEFIDNTFNQPHICVDIQERNYYWKNENSPTGYSCDDGYKIIREIPSEVTWITEGMEFDDLPFLKY